MLFQIRTSTVKTHKGQVSFPGGHLEAGETPVEAALREAREEVRESGCCCLLVTWSGMRAYRIHPSGGPILPIRRRACPVRINQSLD